jgi:hypothetical protein
MKNTIYLLLILSFPWQVAPAQETKLLPHVDHAVYFDVSPPLRNLPLKEMETSDRSWKDGVVENRFEAEEGSGAKEVHTVISDPVVQERFGTVAADTTIRNFDGMRNQGGYVPPDTHGDVGFSHFFQVVNCSYAIYNKNGEKVFGPAGNSSVWNGMPHNSNDGDAVVLFDEQANRWLFSQFSLPNGSSVPPFYQMIAVSQTSDPTGSWYRWVYEFSAMPDYPKFGVWPDGYYMSSNDFGTNSWEGNGACAFDRAAMLAGDPSARRIAFQLPPGSNGFISLLPSDCDGSFPPVGTPNYFTFIRTNSTQRLGIIEFHADWASPANSTFGDIAYLNVAPFTSLGWGNGIPQKDSPQVLETLGDRLMYRQQYRLFGGYAAMVLNHSVKMASGNGAIRWYELRKSGASWNIYQQSTYAPDAHSRWMGSIAQDTAGTISMGYSVSGPDIYPGIRYTGRLKNDPLNQMTIVEKTIIYGGGSQTGVWSGRSRWGDYSALAVDPSSPTTFWYTTEYYPSTSTSSWQTRIASYTFDNIFSSAASVAPAVMCASKTDTCLLYAYGYGGTGNYTYSWRSIPTGFESTQQNPKVLPAGTTKYVAAVSDGTQTRRDTVQVRIMDPPTAFAGNDTTVCNSSAFIPITASANNFLRFLWGSLGDGKFTDPNSLTTAYIPGKKDTTNGSTDLKLIVWPLSPCQERASDMLHIVFEPCSGLAEPFSGKPDLSIRPNPAHNRIFVTITGLKQEAILSISGSDGHEVRSLIIKPNASPETTAEIDVNGFPGGLYFARIRSEGTVAVSKFIVQ